MIPADKAEPPSVLALRRVAGRFAIKRRYQIVCGSGRLRSACEALIWCHAFSVNSFVGAFIWSKRSSGEANPGEYPLCPWLREHLRAHGCIRWSFCIATNRSGRHTCISAKFLPYRAWLLSRLCHSSPIRRSQTPGCPLVTRSFRRSIASWWGRSNRRRTYHRSDSSWHHDRTMLQR